MYNCLENYHFFFFLSSSEIYEQMDFKEKVFKSFNYECFKAA